MYWLRMLFTRIRENSANTDVAAEERFLKTQLPRGPEQTVWAGSGPQGAQALSDSSFPVLSALAPSSRSPVSWPYDGGSASCLWLVCWPENNKGLSVQKGDPTMAVGLRLGGQNPGEWPPPTSSGSGEWTVLPP